QGTQGVGVMIAHSMKELETLLDTMWDLDQEILLQEFVSEARGRDIRALVVGGRVVGAMRRIASGAGEFRSNLHRGGRGEPVKLSPDYEREAIRAACAVGLEVAGVDLLESDSGPKITEVNSRPGHPGAGGGRPGRGSDAAHRLRRRRVSLQPAPRRPRRAREAFAGLRAGGDPRRVRGGTRGGWSRPSGVRFRPEDHRGQLQSG